jgi:flagellar basal-body rod protein FlgC
MFNSFDISASGMTAQRLRMDIIADNIANVNTTRTEGGGPYRRKMPLFHEREGSQGVDVVNIQEDKSPFKMLYNPAHPDADQEGYVKMPNINIVIEMVDLIDASRAYEANVTALNNTKNMALKALEIGKG